MIIDRPRSHYIFVFPRDYVHGRYNYINYKGKDLTNQEYLEYWGKWIILGPKDDLAELAKKVDPHVEKKIIPAAKYEREVLPEWGLGECLMYVYSDRRQREEVREVLASLDVEDKIWAFERESVEGWMPGGRLLEKWISGKGLSAEKAEKVREDARKKFEEMFQDPHALFTGVDQ
jgi:hypothetical protein